MKSLRDYKILLWDFDGVIMDSMPVRDQGFIEVLQGYPKDQVDELIAFHQQNGGLSRYVKFRYFFEKIRGEAITEQKVNELAASFSKIMLSLLLNRELLIKDSVKFIDGNFDKYQMHVVSGSDGNELRYICNHLDLTHYFKTINGSPTPKIELTKNILDNSGVAGCDVCLIGDSKNDYEAAAVNGIDFWGYNNEDMKKLTSNYIHSFSTVG